MPKQLPCRRRRPRGAPFVPPAAARAAPGRPAAHGAAAHGGAAAGAAATGTAGLLDVERHALNGPWD